MGFIARVQAVIKAVRNGDNYLDIKNDQGGGELVRAKNFVPVGDDSQPLPDDYALNIGTQKTGVMAAAGFIDPKNEGQAIGGEASRYGRDLSGAEVCRWHLKGDGTYTFFNTAGSTTLAPDGTTTITNNGTSASAIISATGEVSLLNTNGFIKLLPDGSVSINGFIIDAAGLATDSGGIGLHTHKHDGSPSAPPGGVSDTGLPKP